MIDTTTINENTARLTSNAPSKQSYSSEIDLEVNKFGISVTHLVRPLDEQYIAELADTDESEWEPIEVRVWPATWSKPSSEVEYHVVSGNHRTSAARIKGLQTIRARIIEASDDLSYLLAAIRTNARHGRNFTNDDRKELAAKLKGLGQSSNQIAKLFGVSKSTVDNWLSGRDSNASKKQQQQHMREQAADTLANLGIEDLSEDWFSVREVSADARQIARVGQTINDFFAGTPVAEDKAQVVAWVRSLSIEARHSVAQDMFDTIQWLTNVTRLLKSEQM